MSRTIDLLGLRFLSGALVSSLMAQAQSLPNLFPIPNASGLLETYNAGDKPIDLTGPFFQPLAARV